MEKKLSELETRIANIEARNKKVEINKQWEGSLTRKVLLMIFTYCAVFFYFEFIGVKPAYLNAIVPTLGFLLSTLTLPFFKSIWIRVKNKK